MRRKRLLIATHNKGKVAEYADILKDFNIAWLTLDEAGVSNEIEETGDTFYENAVLKATGYARETGLLTLADDSGLEVDILNGAPGVLTARYGGQHLTPAERYRFLLVNLSGVAWEERSARFRCIVALAGENGALLGTSEGVCEGMIALEPAGDGGFGYDPVFYLPDLDVTMAQLPPHEKHRISHRGRAAYAIAPIIRKAVDSM